MASEQERIAHVVRRLGYGANAEIIDHATSIDDAIGRALDLRALSPTPPDYPPPLDQDDLNAAFPSMLWWIEQMGSGRRLIEERMIWFWHDHFAMHVRKIGIPYLAIQHHHLLRRHATGNFADLLHAVAVDPAMLLYLDTARSTAESPNENFAREVMELHTLGTGNYTEQDVIELARATTGWVVANPVRRQIGFAEYDDAEPWTSLFVPSRWDSESKTVLGASAAFDMTSGIDHLLAQSRTAEFIVEKLYTDLVGIDPEPNVVSDLAASFRTDYEIITLIEAIAAVPAFTSDAAVNAKVRSPLEKLAGLLAGFDTELDQRVIQSLSRVSYLPFTAPNPAGYAKGLSLLGPYQYVHVFDLAAVVQSVPDIEATDLFARLGVHDVTPTSLDVVAGVSDPSSRLALAIASPEYALV
jgi:uncharacterized protein (DUF1800 family)